VLKTPSPRYSFGAAMTDEEALALERRAWARHLKTLPEKERKRLRRLRNNQHEQRRRERMDEEAKEHERELKREWWQRSRTSPEFKRKRAAKARRAYRQAKT